MREARRVGAFLGPQIGDSTVSAIDRKRSPASLNNRKLHFLPIHLVPIPTWVAPVARVVVTIVPIVVAIRPIVVTVGPVPVTQVPAVAAVMGSTNDIACNRAQARTDSRALQTTATLISDDASQTRSTQGTDDRPRPGIRTVGTRGEGKRGGDQ